MDASVFLNAFKPYEQGHKANHDMPAHLHCRSTLFPSSVPTLLLPEVAAAISRGRQDVALAREFALALTRLPHMVMVPLDDTLARQALEVAAGHRLRGSDAVYAAVALRFGSTLVTLDREQQERVPSLIPVCRPVEFMDELE